MDDIETKIAAWRAQLRAALPGQETTVRELEDHVRDHYATLLRRGVPAAAALAQSMTQIGEPRAIAAEFRGMPSRWLPGSALIRVVLALFGTAMLAILALLAGGNGREKMTLLLGTHVFAVSSGFLALLASGLIGAGALLQAWRLPLTAREQRELRQTIFRLTYAACALVAVGIGLGLAWAASQHLAVWSWQPVETGAVCTLVCATAWLVVQYRTRRHEKVSAHWWLVVAGDLIFLVGWFAAGARTGAVPIGPLYLALLASQAALALLRPASAFDRERMVAA